MRYRGILHDIGKMRVPEPILNKQGKFTDTEFMIMKKHPEHGIDILKDSHGISDLSKSIVIERHERYNGNGYPLQALR
jgi:HD-GYP domain-containing protein (c-di-GMP phosphodiesterase class II)